MSALVRELREKITQHRATVAIIGQGYVGLPLAVEFAGAGLNVIGFEVSEEKCAALNRGESYITDVQSSQVAAMVRAGRYQATTDTRRLREADAIIVCVPTPLNKTHEPDLSYVIAAADSIVAHGRPEQLVVLESTTYPGTTNEILRPRLEAAGYTIGEDYWLAFSPERIDPANHRYGVRNTPKVVGGTTPACVELASALYGQIVERVVPVSSTEAAEMVKLLENTFRMVNIGLVNEVALWCHRMGLDVWEVIDAAATKPFGFMPFYPGPGLGGHCIPIDPIYLSWKLRGLNHTARFIELAREINLSMPQYVVTRVADALNDDGKALRGAQVLVLGVAYKPNVSDPRESPALEILQLLETKGARVVYADPYIPQVVTEQYTWQAHEITDELLRQADCVLVVTHHSDFPWDRIAAQSRLIVDTRNALAGRATRGRLVRM
jgi:UDP-N-acetyl-D-glucosamine dehydrogenase